MGGITSAARANRPSNSTFEFLGGKVLDIIGDFQRQRHDQACIWPGEQHPLYHQPVGAFCQGRDHRPGFTRIRLARSGQSQVDAGLQFGDFRQEAVPGNADPSIMGNPLIAVTQLDHGVAHPRQDIRDALDELAVFILFQFGQFFTPHHSPLLGGKYLGQLVFRHFLPG